MLRGKQDAVIHFYNHYKTRKVYHSKLMLYLPCRNKDTDILSGYMYQKYIWVSATHPQSLVGRRPIPRFVDNHHNYTCSKFSAFIMKVHNFFKHRCCAASLQVLLVFAPKQNVSDFFTR